MANTFEKGVWVLDTANTTAFLLGVTGYVRIKRIKFEPSASSDAMIFKDRHGNVKVTETALAASPAGDILLNYEAAPLEIDGPILHTLDGGTVYVYLAD